MAKSELGKMHFCTKSVNSHTCVNDAIFFAGLINGLEVTLTKTKIRDFR